MAGKSAILSVKIISDAKNAISGMKQTGDAGMGLASKLGKAGIGIAAFGAAAVGAAVVAGKALYNVGEVFDDVSDTIRVGTGASGEALAEMEGIAKNIGRTIPAEYGKIGPAVADLNTRLDLTGPVLQTVASQALEVGRILGEDLNIERASAAFNGFQLEAKAVPAAMDQLFRVSQSTGISMNQLSDSVAKNSASLRTLGFDFQTAASMTGIMDKAGIDSTRTLSSMGRGLMELAKSGEAPAEVFPRVIAELEGFISKGDQAGALNLAGKVFGTKGAPQFIGAIESGALNLEQLKSVADGTGDTILGLGAETADFAEQWILVKNNVLAILEPIGTQVFNVIGDLAGAFAGILQDVDLSSFTEMFSGIGDALGAIFDAIGPAVKEILPSLGKLAPTISPFKILLDAFAPLLPQIGEAFNSIAGVITGTVIPAVIDISGKIVPLITKIAATLMPPLLSLITRIVPLVGRIVAALTPLITTLVNALIPVVEAILPIVTSVINAIVPIIEGAISIITGVIQTFTAILTGDWGAAWEGIETIVTGVLDTVTGIITGAAQIIQTTFSSLWDTVTGIVSAAWDSIKRSVSTGISSVVSTVRGLPGKAVSALGSIGTKLYESGKSLIQGLINGIGAMGSALWTKVSALPGDALRALGNVGTKLYESGKQLVQGFINGIGAMAGALWDKAKSLGSDALGAIGGALGISSPSKKAFALGKFVTEGFINGVAALENEADRQMAKIFGIPEKLAPPRLELAPLPASMSGLMTDSRAGTIINITVNGALDALAVGRQIESILRQYSRVTRFEVA